MGYYIELEDSRFHVCKGKVQDVMDALCGWVNGGGVHGRGWVGTSTVNSCYENDDVEGMFRECRWPVTLDSEGNIVDISFEGSKIGDDEDMFMAIAKFITDKSYVQIRGEEGEVWRWYFIGGRMKEDHVKRTWSSDSELE